jgi:hypothetical protein
MAIQSTLHGCITKIVSVRSADWPLSLIYISFLCLEIGKASPLFKEGSAVGYYNRVIEVSSQPTSHFPLLVKAHSGNQFNKFEVLIGDPRAIRWVAWHKKLNVQGLNATPVEGGIASKNGAPLYITRVRYDDGVHAAKAAEFFTGSILAFGGKEVAVDVSYRSMVWSPRNVLLTRCLQEYEVLCLN